MKEIKVGHVYFENEILKVVYANGYYHGHFMYEVYFLGDCSKESIDEAIKKRIAAYALIPDGCKVIPKDLIGMFKGLFIGGVLKDSIKIVYGICDNGITGFSCSVFFIPNQEHLDSIMDYSSIIGDFKTK